MSAATAEPEVDIREEVEAAEPDQERQKQPPYALIVLNNEHNTIEWVMELLVKVCRLREIQALVRTLEIHQTGRAVVWTGAREVAELKLEQIRSAKEVGRGKIQALIEPMPE